MLQKLDVGIFHIVEKYELLQKQARIEFEAELFLCDIDDVGDAPNLGVGNYHLGYVRSSYYWQIKKPQFDADERGYRSYGRATYYGSRYKSQLGDLYTGLVLEVWSTGKITNHNAAEYMGIKNISHLNDIRNLSHPLIFHTTANV